MKRAEQYKQNKNKNIKSVVFEFRLHKRKDVTVSTYDLIYLYLAKFAKCIFKRLMCTCISFFIKKAFANFKEFLRPFSHKKYYEKCIFHHYKT